MMEKIGWISNYYGELFAKQEGDKYYWIIEDHSTNFNDIKQWEEISKELYDQLIQHARKWDTLTN